MHSGEWRLLPLFSVAACDFLLCLSSLSPFSLSRSLLFFLHLPVEHILFCSFPFSSRLFLSPLSENFYLSVFCCYFFASLLTVFSPLTLLPVSVTLDFYISTLLLAAHSLYGLSFFLFSLSTPNKASRSPNDCFKHLDSTVGYLGNAKFWCTESK